MKSKFKVTAMLAVLLCALPGCLGLAQATEPDSTFSNAQNDFGFRLLRTLARGTSRNVTISPYSVSIALAMTYNGAAGDTKAAMAKTLSISGLSDGQVNRDCRQMIETVDKADSSVQIETANALWAQSGFPLNPDFLKVTHDYFGAPVESLDFMTNAAGAADTINAWVSHNTHGKIPTIIERPDPATRLILTDAVYFKGRWQRPFDKSETQPRAFHLQSASPADVQIPMMAQSGDYYPYLETETFQAIALPYGNGRFQMYVFLPRGNTTLRDFTNSLDESHWREWTGKLISRKGSVVLPKFETTYAQKLNDALKAMGMAVAFDAGRADFSLIHQPPPPLNIDDVEHKTYVKVDEEGTEAAATTSVGITALAMVAGPPPFTMLVDHPFFFAITERETQAVLFAGLITNPAEK